MRQLLPFWFAPAHQPREGVKVEFHLRPLDSPLLLDLQVARMNPRGVPDGATTWSVFDFAVTDWRGLEEQFTAAAKREARASGDPDWMFWSVQIAGELYARAILKEEERKNS